VLILLNPLCKSTSPKVPESATFQSSLETYKLEENYVDEKKQENSENGEYSETEKLRDGEFWI